MLLILAPKLGGGSHALLGDALGLGTACFYAAYILAVARLRTRHGTGIVMFASTLVFTLLLLPLALLQPFLPATAHGWWVLIGCAVTAQVLGQSLIAYALAHLPATFSAVGLYVQVIAAAAYAWLLLHERLAPVQIAGGVVVLLAIALARRVRRVSGAAGAERLTRSARRSSRARRARANRGDARKRTRDGRCGARRPRRAASSAARSARAGKRLTAPPPPPGSRWGRR